MHWRSLYPTHMDKCFHFHSTQGVGHSQFQSISLQRCWKSGKVALCSVLLREASFHILSMSVPAALQPAASVGPGESSLEGASGFELPLSEMPTEAKAPKVTTCQFMTCWFMTRQFMTHLNTYMEGRVLRTQPRGRTCLCGRRYIMTVVFPSCASVPALSNSWCVRCWSRH